MLLFSFFFCVGYFDSEKILLDIEINIFRGELTDISAYKEALDLTDTLAETVMPVTVSEAFIAEISLRSPRKSFIHYY